MRRWVSLIAATGVIVPVLAAARPACCVKPVDTTPKGCCAPAAAGMAKGCCKAPEAPKPEAMSKVVIAALVPVAPAASPATAQVQQQSAVEATRVARLDHRAPSPTDSPPDRLSLHRTLLI